MKGKEDVLFDAPVSSIQDFIPMAVANVTGKRALEIVGTDAGRTKLRVFSEEDLEYFLVLEIDLPYEGEDVAVVDFDRDGMSEFLVLHRDSDHNGYMVGVYSMSGECKILQESQSVPFLFATDNLDPALLIQDAEKRTFQITAGSKKELIPASSEDFGQLHPGHSSGFVDINGDGIADMLLDTWENGNRVLEVWINSLGKYILRDRISLPDMAGPLVFGDFLGNGGVDVLFFTNSAAGITATVISNEDIIHGIPDGMTQNKPEKTSYGNGDTVSTRNIPSSSTRISFPELEDFNMVLYKNGMPVIPSMADLNNDSYPDLLVILEHKTSKKTSAQVLLTDGKGSIRVAGEMLTNDSVPGLENEGEIEHAFYFDPQSSGSPHVVLFTASSTSAPNSESWSTSRDSPAASSGAKSPLNFNLNPKPNGNIDMLPAVIQKSSTISQPIDGACVHLLKTLCDYPGHHLSLATILGNRNGDDENYAQGVIGTVYRCRIVETERSIVGFYPPQSFYSLQPPICTIGLGQANVFISSLFIGPPSQDFSSITIRDKIVPNSDLTMVVDPESGSIRPYLYLNKTTYWSFSIPIFLSLLLFFGLISGYFTLKERRRTTKHVKRRNRYSFDYGVL